MNKEKKKFWKKITLKNYGDTGSIFLDNKPLKTPASEILILPILLCKKVFLEWDGIVDKIKPLEMPYYSYSVTAIDRILPQRNYVISQLVSVVKTDLICYREGDNIPLKKLQGLKWQPFLDWSESKFGVKLDIIESLMPISQPNESIIKFEKLISSFDDFGIAGLHNLVTISGSLILSLALYFNQISVKDFYDLALLEELFQVEKWGEDFEASDRRKGIFKEFQEAKLFLDIINPV